MIRPSLGEAVQLYAVVAAGLGLAAAGWGLLGASDRIGGGRHRTLGATLLAIAAAWTTTYLLAGAGLFSATGRHPLSLSRLLFHAAFSVP